MPSLTNSELNKENDRPTVQDVPSSKTTKNEKVNKNTKSRSIKPRMNRATELLKKKKEKDLNESMSGMNLLDRSTSSLNKSSNHSIILNKHNNKEALTKVEKTKIIEKDAGIKESTEKNTPLSNKNNVKKNLPSKETKSKKLSKSQNQESPNHKITDYFQVRKSTRNLKKNFENQILKDLEKKILDHCETGLKIEVFKDKGRGIVTTKQFFKGDFVLEYVGDLIDKAAAQIREEKYSKNEQIGCYMYYFKHKDTQYCIDATAESGKFGRLVNHSRKCANLISKIIEVQELPHLVFFAKTDIPLGTELLYDYGDRSKNSVQNHPWLNL